MSEFIAFLPPPGPGLANYNSAELHTSQPAGVPEIFRDAMSVREEVYVEEQKIPLENEFDLDDPRSFHWVAYASVGVSSEQQAAAAEGGSTQNGRKGSTANKLAVGTIRMVPPPHPPHPEPDSHRAIDNHESVPPPGGSPVSPTAHSPSHEPQEPYIKLGRLAVLPPFRRLGLGRLLIDAALEWVAQNASSIIPPLSPTTAEQRRLELGREPENAVFKGLVLVHAQTSVQKVWRQHGFVRDESMGVWFEEGIEHVGMWKRVELRPEGRRGSILSP